MSQSAAVRNTVRTVPKQVVRQRPAPPRLRVVAPSSGGSPVRLVLLSLALLGSGLLVLLTLNISLADGTYALDRAQKSQRLLNDQQRALQEQIEAEGAPQNLAERGRRLGMVPAPNAAFVQLPKGQVLGEPKSATPPPAVRPPATPPSAVRPSAVRPSAVRPSAARRSATGPGASGLGAGTGAGRVPVPRR
jgi:hypothetical protein